MSNRRRLYFPLWAAVFTAFIGVVSFSNVASNPRFETIHVLDVIRLMTSGAGFAIALMMLTLFFRGDIFSEDKRAGEKSGEEPK